MFVAGGGVRASGAGLSLVALAERLAVPIATSLHGKDTISGDHPLSVGVVGTYSRESANRVVGEADLVCFVGSETGGMTTHFWQVPPIGTPAVQIDIEPQSLGRNYPLEAAVCADAKMALDWMLAHADSRSADRRTAWTARARQIVAELAGSLSLPSWNPTPCRSGPSASATSSRGICRRTLSSWPTPGIQACGMGGMYDLRAPAQSYIRSAGHLGWAFPAGLGAKCAAPERPVFVFTGDAGFWYHLTEIETAVRCGINTVTLVNNNSSGNQGSPGFDRAYGGQQSEQGRELWTYNDVNFAAIAEAMGALGLRVENPADLPGALKTAFASERPTVIDVVSDIEAQAPLAVIAGPLDG